jgi:hypothetical protein
VRVTLSPALDAVRLVVKEIHHLARVYSLFDVAQILLASRERYQLHFSCSGPAKLYVSQSQETSVWETKEQAIAHFWQSSAVEEFYETEDVEVDPPAGNFQTVARCGMSGELLGPPNFHSYQANLRRIHRERFSHLPFEVYSSRVRSERGEEAVNAWLESMKKRTRWRAKGAGDDAWTFDRTEIERDFLTSGFEKAFKEVTSVELNGNILARNLSLGVLACVRIATSHTKKHPAILIPAICRMLESEHLAVFKREGKLFTGPARPHPLTVDAVLAERPSAMVEWIEKQENPKLSDLWKNVLPEGQTEPCNEWLADLFWLLTQGHVLLFADDSIILPRRRAAAAAPAPAAEAGGDKAAKKKKRKKRKRNRSRKVRVVNHVKLIRTIARTPAVRLHQLHSGEALIWKRRLARRGRISSLLKDGE